MSKHSHIQTTSHCVLSLVLLVNEGVIMGSDSDLPTVKPALVLLKAFKVPFEVSFVSAHRTPERLHTYATTASKRGLKVIIAAAGGAGTSD
jgi:phosphoribosylaminoimidazole carboxylase PurE protein